MVETWFELDSPVFSRVENARFFLYHRLPIEKDSVGLLSAFSFSRTSTFLNLQLFCLLFLGCVSVRVGVLFLFSLQAAENGSSKTSDKALLDSTIENVIY